MTSNSPCAACKFLRRKCTQECPFAPYFPPDQPQKFANVHKVFGASNVSKLLQDLNPTHREDAVNSLAYEAEARLRDPVYGCIGLITSLNQRLRQVQQELFEAKKELCTYTGPTGMLHPLVQQSHHHILHQQHHNQNPSSSIGPFGIPAMELGLPPGPSISQPQLMIREQQQQQQQRMNMIDQSQHLVAVVAREQELMRNYEQQQQQELARYNTGYDTTSGILGGAGFNQFTAGLETSVPVVPFDNPFQLQHQQRHSEERHHQAPSQQRLQ